MIQSPECSVPIISSNIHLESLGKPSWLTPRARKVGSKRSKSSKASKGSDSSTGSRYLPVHAERSEYELRSTNFENIPSVLRYFEKDIPEEEENSSSTSEEERPRPRSHKVLTFHKDAGVGPSSEEVSQASDKSYVFEDWHAHKKEYER